MSSSPAGASRTKRYFECPRRDEQIHRTVESQKKIARHVLAGVPGGADDAREACHIP